MYHTGDKIFDIVCETVETWSIKLESDHVFVRDNASNMQKSFSDREFLTFGCAVHTIQLVVVDVIVKQNEHEDLCKKIRGIVGHFKHSIKANKLLTQYQTQNKFHNTN